MLVIDLANICTSLGIVNKATIIAYKVVPHLDSMLTYIKIKMITNLHS